MKAVILAAGMGMRLGNLIPKPLTTLVNEKTILDFLVEKFTRHVGLHNIIVVVGYKKELIMEKFPELSYVYNSAYAHTNTSKSLLLALQKIDDDVLWVNGDVFMDDEVIEKLKESSYSACLVDTKKCGEEEVKYSVNAAGFIHYLSKTVKQANGEALGVNIILRKDLSLFQDALKHVDNRDYFEKGLENLTTQHIINMLPINVGDAFCQEIDFNSDLEHVRQHISTHDHLEWTNS
ncbi:MAG TPA: phosphocholine cytidylyltransferase family protein [Patescibacteria group bacterium]|nr:phosphocholine cytidylyltransferase family protein [Patescibacteria group bacterium]